MEAMPIHPQLRGQDFPTIQNYLRITLCRIHDLFATRADLPTLVDELRRGEK